MAKTTKRMAIMDSKAPAKGGKMPMAEKGGKKVPAFLQKKAPAYKKGGMVKGKSC